MIIYDATGTVLLDIEVDDTAVRYKAIKGENSLTLKFSLDEHLEVPIGSYCMFKDERYSLMLPEDLTMRHRREFEYVLVMYTEDARAKRYKFVNPVDGRLKFSLTAKPIEHLQMFIDNMNKRDGSGWEIMECPDHAEITLSYNHTSCHDALVQLADKLELDYWFVGRGVHLGKLELNKSNPLPLSYGGDGEGLKPDVKRTNYSDALPIEVLYVQGSSTNINPSRYKINGNPVSELRLPRSLTIGYDGTHFSDESGFDESKARYYKTDDNGYSIVRADKTIVNHSEDSLDCSDIEPTKEEEIVSVIEVDKDEHFYDILFSSDVDYPKYVIGGENATVVFQSGMLAGKEFDLATDEYGFLVCKKEGELWRVEIVPQEIDGITMPDEPSGYLPVEGDVFKVFGVQLPDEYVSEAETKMLRYAVEYFYANEDVQYTISGELDEIYTKRNWESIKDRLALGSYISFSDRSFQGEPLLIRITGIKEYVNKPYSPQLEISNAPVSGTLVDTVNRIENQEAYTEDMVREAIAFSKRRWRNAKETIGMLQDAISGFSEGIDPITVETMAMLVGDERLQFVFTQSLESDDLADFSYIYRNESDAESGGETEEGTGKKNQIVLNAAYIKHMTLGIDSISPVHADEEYKRWALPEKSHDLDPDKGYYIYAEVSKTEQTGEFVVSEQKLDDTETHYRLLVAIANKENEDSRSIVTLYGFSEILPGRITTDKIASSDGKTYLDLLKGILHLNDMAGISGVKTEDKGDKSIAAWFGGAMEDKELDEDADNPAKAVIRHDGTGYFANGNFKWDAEGGAEFGGGDLKVLPDGSIVFGKDIKISAESDETLGTILTFMANFKDLFYLTEDGKSIGTKYNFFSELEISSNGLHAGSGGGTGGSSTLAGLMDVTLSSPASGNILVYNGTHWVNKPQSELVPDIDLLDYYTRTEVDTKLGAYIKTTDADKNYAPLSGFNTLKSDFDALNAALNDDVSGKINTWNEIVDFVDEYSGSEDLATIISGINAEVNKRLLISTFDTFLVNEYNPLKAKVTDLEQFEQTTNGILGDLTSRMVAAEAAITTNTTAIQAVDLKVTTLGNHMTEVDETIVAIQTQTDGINERLVAVETWKETTDTTVQNLSTQVSTNKTNIEKILGWFQLDSSGNLYTTYNFYSTKEISANGLGQGTEESGLIKSVLGVSALGTSLTEDNTAVFNAFATNKVYNDLVALVSRVDNLATTTSAVGWKGEITSGKKIGTLTINGLENYLYAPATYAFSEITGKPTTLSGYGITDAFKAYGTTGAVDLNTVKTNGSYYVSPTATNLPGGFMYGQLICSRNMDTMSQIYVTYNRDIGVLLFRGGNDANGYYAWHTVLDNANYTDYAYSKSSVDTKLAGYLPLTGGTLSNGNFNPLTIKGNSSYSGIGFVRSSNDAGYLVYLGGTKWHVTSEGWATGHDLLHLGNYSQYALQASNGDYYGVVFTSTLADGAARLILKNNNDILIGINSDGTNATLVNYKTSEWLGLRDGVLKYYDKVNERIVLHSGNIEDYAMLAAIGSHSNPTSGITKTGVTSWSNGVAAGYRGEYGTSLWVHFNPKGTSGSRWRNRLDFATTGQISLWQGINTETMSYIGELAYMHSNVASATKLATARTIWGQSFDGTGNIMGDLSLIAQDAVDNRDSARLRFRGNTWRDNGPYIQGIAGYGYGMARLAFFQSSILNWTGDYFEAMSIIPSGKVGIGTTSPEYELHVNGTLGIQTSVGQGQVVTITDSSALSSFGRAFTALYPNAVKGAHIDMYVGVANSAKNGGYLGFYYDAAASDNNRISLGLYAKDNVLNINGKGHVLINTTVDSGNELEVNGKAYANNIYGGNSIYAKNYLFMNYDNSGIYLSTSSISWHSGNTYKSSLLEFTQTSVKISQPLTAGATTLSSLTVSANINCNYMLAKNSVQAGLTSTYSTYIDGASDGGRMGVLKNGVHSATLLKIQEDGKGLFYNTILANSANAIQFVYGNYGVIHRNDGSSYYILLTNSGYSSGTFNDLRPFRINLTNGNVGMGHNLSVSGTVTVSSQLSVGYTGSHGYQCYIGGTYTKGLYVGKDAVFKGNIEAEGEISGNVLNTGSDIRFKSRIEDVVLDLDTMADAPMFRFTWNNRKDDRVYIGSSAQYWKGTSARELVSRGCDDFHRLDYATLGVLFGVSLAKKAKNHGDRIKELEMKVESLEQENRRLRYGN